MEVSFALITEGITDQVAIEAILKGHYKALDPEADIIVNRVQPLLDVTDSSKQGSFAGWEEVLAACADERAHKALGYNDYLVVQIDTDVGEHPNFGLPLTCGGMDIAEPVLINDAEQIIAGRFGVAWPSIAGQVVMAISVHSLECWLLAMHSKRTPCETKGCGKRLSRELREPVEKTSRSYEKLSKDFRNPARLHAAASRSTSLAAFLHKLPQLPAA